MKVPTSGNIRVARQIYNLLLTWNLVDKLLYSEFIRLPRNVDCREVACKATLVDRLYNCNLKVNIIDVANHIVSLNIDPDLSNGKTEIVDEISELYIKGKKKRVLVFASKYCHFHESCKFPVWDKFVAIELKNAQSCF